MATIDVLDAYWQDIRKTKTLTEEQECALAERIKGGDDKAVDQLVTANLKYVVSVARQIYEKGAEVSMDDLISEGNIAMLMAARKWDPCKEPRFVNYAQHDIKKAMMAALPQQGAMMTLPKRSKEEASKIRRFSTDAPVHPGQTNTLGDMLKAGKPMTDDSVQEGEMSYAVMNAFHCLNEREVEIVTHYYGIGTDDKMTMAEIGERMGIKRERVRQIRKTAERKMRRVMRKD